MINVPGYLCSNSGTLMCIIASENGQKLIVPFPTEDKGRMLVLVGFLSSVKELE